MHKLTIRIALALAAFTLTPSSFAQDAPDIDQQEQTSSPAGSYRLVGVMETASRLQLEPDGTYKWMLIVGNLDLYSQGRWTQNDGQVILGPHEFSRDTPVFTLGTALAWDRAERDAIYNMYHIRMKNRAKRTCAFLTMGGVFSSAEDISFPSEMSPEQQFEAAANMEKQLQTEYEKAIDAYLTRDISDLNDNMEIRARTARRKWEHAVALLAKSARAVGKAGRYQPPALPAQCLFMSDYTPKYPATGKPGNNVNWLRGAGVWIGRRDRPNSRLKIDTQFSFTDGSTTSANTHELGFAFAPITDGRQLKTITLSLIHDDERYSSTFDIAPDKRNNVYEVQLDRRVFIDPPFKELRLKIADGKLMPTDGSKGAYIKRK